MNSNNTAFVNFVSLPLLVLRASISAWLTLVAVGQNILLLLVSRPTILLLNILFQVFALFLSMKLERHHVQFFTAVCNDWLLLLESDEAKDIVVNALHYQVKVGHVKIAAFVIMPPIIFISSGAFKMNAGLKMCSVIF